MDNLWMIDWWLIPPLKNMSSSIGMMKFPIEKYMKSKKMFQTTNQMKITHLEWTKGGENPTNRWG